MVFTMATFVRTKAIPAPVPKITPLERKARMSALLKQADQLVKEKRFDEALEKTRMVYEYDPANMYAKAYEERILTLKFGEEKEKTRQHDHSVLEKDINERVEAEVQRRIAEIHTRQEEDINRKKAQELEEDMLEQQMRRASAHERKEHVNHEISTLEAESLKHIQEREAALAGQIQRALEEERKRIVEEARTVVEQARQSVQKASNVENGFTELEEKLRKNLEQDLQRMKEQMMIETVSQSALERRSMQAELLEKFKQERQRAEEDIQRQLEEERRAVLQREQQKAKERALETYKMQVVLLSQLPVSSGIRDAVLRGLRITLDLTDEDHASVEGLVQVDSYVGAVKEAWRDGEVGKAERDLLKELGDLYQVPEPLRTDIAARVMHELGVPTQSKTILILDDEDYILEFPEAILKQTYETVLTAKSVEQAIQCMRQAPPSLLLCDINLNSPEITGFTFCERLRSGAYGDALKTTPFIIMSAVADDFFIKAASQLGAKGYLQKPFTREKLESTIRSALM